MPGINLLKCCCGCPYCSPGPTPETIELIFSGVVLTAGAWTSGEVGLTGNPAAASLRWDAGATLNQTVCVTLGTYPYDTELDCVWYGTINATVLVYSDEAGTVLIETIPTLDVVLVRTVDGWAVEVLCPGGPILITNFMWQAAGVSAAGCEDPFSMTGVGTGPATSGTGDGTPDGC